MSNLSMSTSFVLVTVTDAKTGMTKSGCTAANGLLGAIHREHRIGYDEKSLKSVLEIAMATSEQRFTFANADALANVGFANLDTQFPEECALIRAGWTATRSHRGNLLFTNKPGYRPTGNQGPD